MMVLLYPEKYRASYRTLTRPHGHSWALTDAHGREWALAGAREISWVLTGARPLTDSQGSAHGELTFTGVRRRSLALASAHGRLRDLAGAREIVLALTDAGERSPDLSPALTCAPWISRALTKALCRGLLTVSSRSRTFADAHGHSWACGPR